ncbi:primosomal protein DnaI [Limosilactobacillus kribbianus]|uniref:primosomal protein DnaI n=1 Tax=Limosilactobacillus kribbianus TaxID=2982695 RepID=UPI002263D190|nr:primosomal protein DnaI [Limosilactobacillus kribbianus]
MESLNKTIQKMMQGRNVAANMDQIMKQVYADPEVRAFLNQHRDQLTAESVRRGRSKLYEFFHEKQLIKEGKATVAPGYSPQLQLDSGQIDVTYVPTQQLIERRHQAHLRQLVNSINMPKFIRRATFADYYLDDQNATAGRVAAYSAAEEFVKTYSPDHFQPGLYLTGSFGVGKTYLLAATANALAQREVATTMVHFPSFAVEMKNSIRNNNAGEKIDAVKRSPVLMLDDIGADAMSTWVRDDVLGVILEYRMQEELPTFFSSNFSMAELEKQHLAINNQGVVEPVKAARIMERIEFLSREIQMNGENLRKKG